MYRMINRTIEQQNNRCIEWKIDTFLVPSYFISYFRHHSVHSVHQLNFWIIKSQLLRNKTHDVCLCVMCVLCDVCAVCDVCAWCVWRWWSHAVQRGVCLSGTHRVFLAGSRGSSPHIVLLLHSNISDFFFFFFFTRLHRDPMAGKLGLPSIFGAHQNDL